MSVHNKAHSGWLVLNENKHN